MDAHARTRRRIVLHGGSKTDAGDWKPWAGSSGERSTDLSSSPTTGVARSHAGRRRGPLEWRPSAIHEGLMSDTHDPATRHPGLTALFHYPLMSAIAERRSRRVCRGTSIDGGELSHQRTNAPAPLSALEEAVLVVTTGLNGFLMHDGPVGGGGELGTGSYFMQPRGRTAGSPDNTQPTSFFLVNDT